MRLRIRLRSRSLLPTLVFLLFSGALAADEFIRSTLDLAGQQRMHAQRTLKAYCQMGQEIRYLAASDQLKQTRTEFKANHQALTEMSLPAGAQDSLARVLKLWAAVEDIIAQPVAKEQAEPLHSATEALLGELNGLFAVLAERTRETQSELLVQALEQEMLSQRVAALYMMLNWGFDSEAYRAAYSDAVAQFDETLMLLATSPANNPETRAELIKITRKWEMLEDNDQGANKTLPNLMVRVLDRIQEQMNVIVQDYIAGHAMDTGDAAE